MLLMFLLRSHQNAHCLQEKVKAAVVTKVRAQAAATKVTVAHQKDAAVANAAENAVATKIAQATANHAPAANAMMTNVAAAVPAHLKKAAIASLSAATTTNS